MALNDVNQATRDKAEADATEEWQRLKSDALKRRYGQLGRVDPSKKPVEPVDPDMTIDQLERFEKTNPKDFTPAMRAYCQMMAGKL